MTLVPVSEFAKQQAAEGKKFSTPQKINYAIRKQGAPVDQTTGKRMIDPEAWSAWEENNEQVTKQAKSSGNSPAGMGARVQRKTGAKEGEFLAWKSGRKDEKISAGKITSANDHYAGTMIDDIGIHSPLSWDAIDRYIREGKMMVVNYPEQLLYVLAHHYKGVGEKDTYEQLIELYEQHKKSGVRSVK